MQFSIVFIVNDIVNDRDHKMELTTYWKLH